MRKMLFLGLILHCALVFLCLAMVGFEPMLINLIQACWIYSCFLTLRERQVILYFALLAIQAFYAIYSTLRKQPEGYRLSSSQLLGRLICLSVVALIFYTLGRAYYAFRKTGGLHGTGALGHDPKEALLPEEIAAQKGLNLAERVAGHASKAVTDYIDKTEDEES